MVGVNERLEGAEWRVRYKVESTGLGRELIVGIASCAVCCYGDSW